MQHVNSPTHLKGNILDFVLTNVDTIQDLMVSPTPHSLASDHYTITFSMKFGKQKNLKTSSRYVFDFSKADLDGLNSYLLDSDFSECFHSASVKHIWVTIKQTIYNTMHLFIPKVKLKSYECPKWFTPDIRHLSNCCCTLRRKCKPHPTPHNCSKLKLSVEKLQAK